LRRVRGIGLVAAALIGALTLAACGSNDDNSGGSGSGSGGSAAPSNLKIGMAYDIGGRGDKSFNDSAAVGLDTAKKNFGLSDDNVKELSARAGETDMDRATRLELLAKSGFNPVLAVGFAYAPALKTVAPKYPNVKFGIVDATTDDVSAPNVSNLTFAEEQGSFLVGAAAGLKTQSGTVGFIGGCSVPLIAKFEAGYKAGVEKAKPGTKVVTKYLSTPQQNCSGFNDPAAGQEAAKGMYDGGADVVYAAAGGSGSGVFSAAQAAGKKAIGVDSDQYLSADPKVQSTIMTSMLKRVNVAVLQFLTDNKDGKFKAGSEVFDLKVDGVAYATSGGQVDDIKSKLDDYKKQIVDGTIKVPTTVS
jgi:basic membrane protein A